MSNLKCFIFYAMNTRQTYAGYKETTLIMQKNSRDIKKKSI